VPHRSGYCASKFALHGAWPLHLRARRYLTVSRSTKDSMIPCGRSSRPSTRSASLWCARVL
jgi:cytidine deaminase